MFNREYLKIRSLISEKHKLIFLWTPKAGCTTTKNIFYDYISIELPENRFLVNELIWHKQYGCQGFKLPDNYTEYLVIQFCRNPYDRVVSSFLTHMDHAQCKHKFLIFKDFLQALYENKISCEHCSYHGVKQFMTEKVNDFVKIENLDNELKRINDLYNLSLKNITYENHSHRKRIKNNFFPQEYNKPYEEYLDTECVNLINKIYEKDIEFFKYAKTTKI